MLPLERRLAVGLQRVERREWVVRPVPLHHAEEVAARLAVVGHDEPEVVVEQVAELVADGADHRREPDLTGLQDDVARVAAVLELVLDGLQEHQLPGLGRNRRIRPRSSRIVRRRMPGRSSDDVAVEVVTPVMSRPRRRGLLDVAQRAVLLVVQHVGVPAEESAAELVAVAVELGAHLRQAVVHLLVVDLL